MLELLAPAGSMDALRAAVQNGADAVYLGVGEFNARQSAKNFTIDTLTEALRYCHVRGVQVHLTLNTLVTDRELKSVRELIRAAAQAGVDAFIVQDLGVAQLCRQIAPHVPVHGSTQPKVAGAEFFCPYCGGELTEPKPFNLMFKTVVGPIDDPSNVAYLRPETAQAIFAQFTNVTATSRMAVPYGIAQMGKSFRNEVTPRNYTFRSREFEQMELEFFIRPDEAIELQYGHVVTLADGPDLNGPVQDDWGWEVWHKYWVEQRKRFLNAVGLPTSRFVEYWQKPDELAHYARACVDIEYDFPFGRQELEGIAARGDFDLTQHQIHSKVPQTVFDDPLKQACKKLTDEQRAAFVAKTQKEWVERRQKAQSAKAGKEIAFTADEVAAIEAQAKAFCESLFDGKYVPHVIEPSAGVDRLMLALLCEAYEEQKLTDEKGKEDVRTVLHFHPKVAPVKVAIFPLIKKDPDQDRIARDIFKKLQKKVNCQWDVSGAIGRRYRRQDEAGTPWCITVDAQTVQDGTFTVRERDSMEQKRMTYAEFLGMMYESLEF